MKKNGTGIRGASLSAIAFLSVVCFAALTACSPKVVISFNSLPGFVPVISERGFENHVPEPEAPAGGFVYIQAGLSEDSAVYGPYPVTPGKNLEVRDVPAGKYSRIALFYTPAVLPVREEGQSVKADNAGKSGKSRAVSVVGLPVTAENDGDFWEKTGVNPIAGEVFHDGGAVSLFANIVIPHLMKKTLSARLVPLSSTVFSSRDGAHPPCPDSVGQVRKQFFRVDGTGKQSIYAMLCNYGGTGIVYAGTIALYGGDGSLLETKTFNRRIPEDLPESVLFPLPESGTVWLYAEYIASGDTRFPLYFY